MKDEPNDYSTNTYEQSLFPPDPNSYQQITLIKNQLTPLTAEVKNLKTVLKTSSKFILCPYCHISGITLIDKKCSSSNITCCIFASPLFWFFFQLIRRKDFNCYNAVHRCQGCNTVLVNYNAC